MTLMTHDTHDHCL